MLVGQEDVAFPSLSPWLETESMIAQYSANAIKQDEILCAI